MRPTLRLTAEERLWNDYYTTGGKPGVLQRSDPATVVLDAAHRTVTTRQVTTRRCRVYAITWTGDVYAARVTIGVSTGERLVVTPTHIPLLSGHAPHSTASRLPGLAAYPTTGSASQAAPQFCFLIEPNLVLPGDVQLQFDYDLEDAGDQVIADGGSYLIQHVIHRWEFPGFGGVAT
jgi:hypothetical protein